MADTARLTGSPALPRGFSRRLGPAAAQALYRPPRGARPGRGAPVPAWEVFQRLAPGKVVATVAARETLLDWARAEGESVFAQVKRRLLAVEAERPSFAGLPADRPAVMGIVNTTPDSFSDGGRSFAAADAVANGLALVAAGADILDVGGESTRPGAEPVPVDEELRRVLPVVRAFAERGLAVSIDTRRAAVMAAAVAAGATVINDVTALTGDPDSLTTATRLGVPVVLMHMRGEPRTMQADPTYSFAPLDVFDYLEGRVAACLAAGLERSQICVDPGLGFGKTAEHNAAILARLGLYQGLGCAVLLGISRKSFIGAVSRGEPATERLAGSLAAAVMAAGQGTQILRVHDVAETCQALAVWRAAEATAISGL
jgi:dihydropteroate synthase